MGTIARYSCCVVAGERKHLTYWCRLCPVLVYAPEQVCFRYCCTSKYEVVIATYGFPGYCSGFPRRLWQLFVSAQAISSLLCNKEMFYTVVWCGHPFFILDESLCVIRPHRFRASIFRGLRSEPPPAPSTPSLHSLMHLLMQARSMRSFCACLKTCSSVLSLFSMWAYTIRENLPCLEIVLNVAFYFGLRSILCCCFCTLVPVFILSLCSSGYCCVCMLSRFVRCRRLGQNCKDFPLFPRVFVFRLWGEYGFAFGLFPAGVGGPAKQTMTLSLAP